MKVKKVPERQINEFWLHYIGVGIYRREIFEREAVKLGVQRAIGFNLLSSLEFGQPILLAHYCGRGSDTAEVFGYFTVTGVSHNLPKEVASELLETVNVVKVDSTPVAVTRACGSYVVGTTAYIDETLESLVDKIKQACEKHGINPNNFKWFIKGEYHPFKNSIVLTPIKFTRGYMKVKIEGLDLKQQQIEDRNMVWVFDYERRMYLTKRERDALLSHKLTDYSGD